MLERRKELKIGNAKTVEYVFELDIVNPTAVEEEKKKKEDEPDKLRENFYMNLHDFSIFKLRSIIFFTNFPLAIAIATITCWYKLIPVNPSKGDGFSPPEIEEIIETTLCVRGFAKNLIELIQNLIEYLVTVKESPTIHTNFAMTTQSKEFQQYKHNYYATKGSSLMSDRIDNMFVSIVDSMKLSYADILTNTI